MSIITGKQKDNYLKRCNSLSRLILQVVIVILQRVLSLGKRIISIQLIIKNNFILILIIIINIMNANFM